MRETILRVDKCGLLWTIWRMFSRVLIVRTTSLSDCKETLGWEPVSRNVWWIRVNTLRDGILRSGKRLWYSSTAARALPSQNPYAKCMSQYSTWETPKGMLATCLPTIHNAAVTFTAFTLKEVHVKFNGYSELTCSNMIPHSRTEMDKIVSYMYSAWTTLFSGHYLRDRSTLYIGGLAYIGTL